MTPPNAKASPVDVRHGPGANAAEMLSAETSDASNAQVAQVTSVKAAHAGTHVSSAKAAKATAVSSTTATAPGLRARCKKAACKHRTCQNYHRSSSHNISPLGWTDCSATGFVRHRRVQQGGRQRRDTMEMRTLSCFLN
jgi:hypothetical protein